jgi:hypothetical protein
LISQSRGLGDVYKRQRKLIAGFVALDACFLAPLLNWSVFSSYLQEFCLDS